MHNAWLRRTSLVVTCTSSLRDPLACSQADRSDITQLDRGRNQPSTADDRNPGRSNQRSRRADLYSEDDISMAGIARSDEGSPGWGARGRRMGFGAGSGEAASVPDAAVAGGSDTGGGGSEQQIKASNRAQPEPSSAAHWTANDDWLDALGLGIGPSRDEATAADAHGSAGSGMPASSAWDSAALGSLTQDLAEQRAANNSELWDVRTSEQQRGGGGGGSSEDGWFFNGSSRAAAAVADPTRTRQDDEQRSDRRKAANKDGAGGGFASQRARDADDRSGWRGANGRGSRGRRGGAETMLSSPCPCCCSRCDVTQLPSCLYGCCTE